MERRIKEKNWGTQRKYSEGTPKDRITISYVHTTTDIVTKTNHNQGPPNLNQGQHLRELPLLQRNLAKSNIL